MTEILNAGEVAGLLKLSEDVVDSMIAAGEIPGFTIRGYWRTRRLDFEAWLGDLAVSRVDSSDAVHSSTPLEDSRAAATRFSGQDLTQLITSKTFCAAPWVHFLTLPDGSVLPCCRARDAVRDENGVGYNVRRDSPGDIWNGAGYKKIRRALLDGEEIPHCNYCYETEANNFPSYRQLFNRNYIEQHAISCNAAILERLVDHCGPLTAKKPIFFDLRLGNICNLKCRMCGPGLSSQIEKDEIASAWVPPSSDVSVGEDIDAWPEAVDLLAQLKAFCIDTVRLELIGGEPTLNRGQMEILKHFVDEGVAGDIELLMITNLTNAQDRVYDLVNQFKQPNVHISIEAVGAATEYIRFPIKWKTVASNFYKLREKYNNISFGISPTFQAYNILYLCELFDWCLNNKISFTTGNILSYPSWLSVCVLPLPVRVAAADKLDYWVETSLAADNIKDDIGALASYLRDESQQASEADIDNFVRYTNNLDRSRKQDIRKSLPELYALWTLCRPWNHEAIRYVSAGVAEVAPAAESRPLRGVVIDKSK